MAFINLLTCWIVSVMGWFNLSGGLSPRYPEVWVCVMAWPSVGACRGCHHWYRFDVPLVFHPGVALIVCGGSDG